MRKTVLFFISLLLLTTFITGQVYYQGPANGSVSGGVIVNTNSFENNQAGDNTKYRLFSHPPIPVYPDDGTQLPAAAPEDANLIIDPASLGIDNTEDITLFEDFCGINQTLNIPPDPYVAVGPDHMIQVVNSRFRINYKNGTHIKTILADSWFSSVLPGAFTFDPKVIYDHYEDRWVMVWLHLNENQSEGYILVSVSDDGDPTGVWYNWALPSTTNGNTPAGNWSDYQGVGYDDKAIYVTSNQFTFSFYYQYSKLRILDKNVLYGNAAGQLTWKDLWNIRYPNGSQGAFGLRPARMQSPSNEYYMAVHTPYTSGNTIGVFKVLNSPSNPSITGAQVPVTSYSSPQDPMQLGGGSPNIDGGGLNFRNEPVFFNGALHMVHSVAYGSRSALRYIAVDVSDYSLIMDWKMGDSDHYHTYPALAVNGFGDVVFSYSRSASNEYMGACYTVLKAGETTPIGSQVLKPGNGNYIKTFGGSRNRWGDYNGAWTDPADPENFWVFTEYVHGTNTWGVWAGGINVENAAAVSWQADINVNDGSAYEDMTFGLSDFATDGIDTDLGEDELPPVPPAGVFDSRFVLPDQTASLMDFRNSENTDVVWNISFQPGSAGYPVTFTWEPDSLPAGIFLLKDAILGTLVNVNMKEQNSYTLTNSAITSLNIEYTGQLAIQVPVLENWNIVSVPVTAQDMTVESVFPNSNSAAYKYNNGYVVVDEFENGLGYWLKFPAAEDVEVTGSPVEQPVDLNAGWNIIGPFDSEVNIDNITSEPANIIASAYFGFSGAYYSADVLEPGKGYWVKTSQAGALSYDGTLAKKGANESLNDILGSRGRIIFTDAAGKSISLYALNNGDDRSSFELPPAPPQGIFDVRFEGGYLAENLSTGKAVSLSSLVYPVSIEAEGIEISVRDNVSLINSIIKDGSLFTITDENITKLVIASTSPVYGYSLKQNYPNPFNPTTNISFIIPEKSNVKLSVFNILGQEVMSLVDQSLDAGNHTVKFDASPLSSGVYFYKIEAGNFTESRKMMLMK